MNHLPDARIRMLRSAGTFVALCSLTAAAGAASIADAYPGKLVRVIIPFAAGGSTDLLARTVAQLLNEGWRQPVIAENRPGAAAAIGSEFVARSAPDGHTLLIGTVTSHGVAATLYPKLPYDVQRDFAPVTEIAYNPQILSVHPSMPVKSIKELVALAKARPGQINYGAGSIGATQHMSTELFQLSAGIKMIAVQYRGSGPAMIGLLGGEVQVMFDVVMTSLPHVKSGKLRPLGVTSLQRAVVAPQIPTIAESGYPGFESLVWFGLFAPAGTHPEIVRKIQETVAAGLSTPKMKAHLAEQGLEPVVSTPEVFAKRVASEIVKWRNVIKAAGIRAEL